MHAIVHAADVQDRDGGVLLMATLFGAYPFLLKLYADSGYTGPTFLAWLNRCRRLAKDWERLNRTGVAFLQWASIRLMVRKLCQATT